MLLRKISALMLLSASGFVYGVRPAKRVTCAVATPAVIPTTPPRQRTSTITDLQEQSVREQRATSVAVVRSVTSTARIAAATNAARTLFH